MRRQQKRPVRASRRASCQTTKFRFESQPRLTHHRMLARWVAPVVQRAATFCVKGHSNTMSATTAQRKQVTITTDGACLGNGQNESRAAAAAILEYQGHERAI